jgi:predicted TIM-barrel fold metal-dependent hydrolase
LAALHARLGCRHAVVVQGACHGFDHAALLDALRRGEGRHRGVALLPADVSDATLGELHAAGVRGVRFNFVGHLGAAPDANTIRSICARIAPLGWHASVHLRAADLQRLQPLLESLELPFVIDHMARIDVAAGLQDAGFQRLLALGANPRAWIKVSAFDRACGGSPPFDAARPFAAALLAAYPGRAVWGTDWPHPNIAGAVPDELELLRLLRETCADEETWHAVLVANPRRLYGAKDLQA